MIKRKLEACRNHSQAKQKILKVQVKQQMLKSTNEATNAQEEARSMQEPPTLTVWHELQENTPKL